jgi:hypothetical protein
MTHYAQRLHPLGKIAKTTQEGIKQCSRNDPDLLIGVRVCFNAMGSSSPSTAFCLPAPFAFQLNLFCFDEATHPAVTMTESHTRCASLGMKGPIAPATVRVASSVKASRQEC